MRAKGREGRKGKRREKKGREGKGRGGKGEGRERERGEECAEELFLCIAHEEETNALGKIDGGQRGRRCGGRRGGGREKEKQ